MPRNRVSDGRPCFERLEVRRQLSASIPANSIGTAVGNVTVPSEVTSTSVTVSPKNLTQGKSSTLFGIFVQPEPDRRSPRASLRSRGATVSASHSSKAALTSPAAIQARRPRS